MPVFVYNLVLTRSLTVEELDFIDSKFRLAILAAKRAKQLVGGGRKKIDSDAENPLTVAMEEIFQGKIDFQIIHEPINNDDNINLSLDLDDDDDSSFLFQEEDGPEELLYNEGDGEDEEDDQEEAG